MQQQQQRRRVSSMALFAEFTRLETSGVRAAVRKLSSVLAESTVAGNAYTAATETRSRQVLEVAAARSRPVDVRALGATPRHVPAAVRAWVHMAAGVLNDVAWQRFSDPAYQLVLGDEAPDDDEQVLALLVTLLAATWTYSILVDRDREHDHVEEAVHRPPPPPDPEPTDIRTIAAGARSTPLPGVQEPSDE